MQGQVVRANRGERHAYRPIESQLCKGSNALEIASALLQLHPFTTLYIADIDAIEGNGNNLAIIENLRARFPALELWVDAGIADLEVLAAWQKRKLGHAVIGSESEPDMELLRRLGQDGEAPYPLLSLDFKGSRFRGNEQLLYRTELWFEHVIAMTLSRVGSDAGPDLALLRSLKRRAPQKKFYAAGGVRDARDLESLRQAGARGVLLARALHERRLTPGELAAWAAVTGATGAP